jgi:hypothetical protein
LGILKFDWIGLKNPPATRFVQIVPTPCRKTYRTSLVVQHFGDLLKGHWLADEIALQLVAT